MKTRFRTTRLAVLLLPALLIACEQVKSSSPLSPLIAGPMEGVNITAPKPLQPTNGATVQDRDQPLTLLLLNPQTNSPRPVTMRLQIATDTAFNNIAYAVDGLVPTGGSSLTNYKMPDKLQSGRSYYWRVSAGDGANESGWAPAIRFDVLQPIVIGVPEPKDPVGGVRVSTVTPEITAFNGVSSGPHGPLDYNFQIADNPAFSPIFANADIGEGDTTSGFVMPQVPGYDKTFYWRVRILEATTTGAWSRVETFRSPVAPPPPSTGGGGGGGGSRGGGGSVSSCSGLVNDKGALVQCIHDAVNPTSTVEGAFEVTKNVAWALRGEGGGLLIKNGGENIISWQGYSFAAGRICYPDGHIYKVLSDVPTTNGASWQDNGFVDKSLYVPAIDPTLALAAANGVVSGTWTVPSGPWTRPVVTWRGQPLASRGQR